MAARTASRIPRPSKSALIVLMLCIVVGSSFAGYMKIRSYVIGKFMSTPVRPVVVMENQPVWMSSYLAQSIADSVRPTVPSSPFDKQVLVDAYKTLSANPWVKAVKEVRRVYGKSPGDTLEIECVYRTPAALVQRDDQYLLVANDGILLPEKFSSDELPRIMFGATGIGPTQLRIIQGQTQAPASPGTMWPGSDMAAGLKMAALLSHLSYADDIVRIDVSNVANHPHSPLLTLITKANTQIHWGRPPGDDDFTEATPSVKLAHLQQIYAQYHRLDANQQWLDLRFDHVIYPTVQASIAEN